MKWKLLFIPLILAAIAAMSGVVMWLWNAVMPGIFSGVQSIDYWHAMGLLILCRILFGGFRGRHGHHHGWHHSHRERWARWQAMTPEERAQFHKDRGIFCRPKPEEKSE
ncbi:hypothetical protein [Duganella qianjiadongensis]|uniref:DUF2933 domain-containing protein n=1 Tax=Duganella qianjiadongensis TaxID=2692176 RepID=A0ABW9VKD3_9BURK|nr:hypothetical protein [Duganella qianjiadongensis]MYM38087.1 hypothetical protein [Duganella qianjiadongensis]